MAIFALLPAAGKSSRMGSPKLALPLGNCTVLERVVATLRQAGCPDILLVLGPHVAALKGLAESAGARVLLLGRETPDMRATVECGLDWLEQHEHPATDDAILLLPPDHPALAPTGIEALVAARAAQPQKASIWIPTYQGRRGHPALISWKHVAGMRALPADQGLNVYLRAHASETCEVPCLAADDLCDLDTPEDYDRLRQMYGAR